MWVITYKYMYTCESLQTFSRFPNETPWPDLSLDLLRVVQIFDSYLSIDRMLSLRPLVLTWLLRPLAWCIFRLNFSQSSFVTDSPSIFLLVLLYLYVSMTSRPAAALRVSLSIVSEHKRLYFFNFSLWFSSPLRHTTLVSFTVLVITSENVRTLAPSESGFGLLSWYSTTSIWN